MTLDVTNTSLDPASWAGAMENDLKAIFEQLINTAAGGSRQEKIFNVINGTSVSGSIEASNLTDKVHTGMALLEIIMRSERQDDHTKKLTQTVELEKADFAILERLRQLADEDIGWRIRGEGQFEVTRGEAGRLNRALTVLGLLKDKKRLEEVHEEMHNPTKICHDFNDTYYTSSDGIPTSTFTPYVPKL